MKKGVEYWFELSDYDYETAKVLYKSKIYMYVVFMCHQAIEKSLKAYYTAIKDVWPLKIHSLWKLTYQTGLYLKLDKEQIEFIGFLEPLNVESRYPSYRKAVMTFVPDRKNCRKLLSDTLNLLEIIKKECTREGMDASVCDKQFRFSEEIRLTEPSMPDIRYMNYFMIDADTIIRAYKRRHKIIF